MTFQQRSSDSAACAAALQKARAAEQALSETDAAARRKLELARQQRELHAGSVWDWNIGVEDAEATLACVRAQLADVRALLEQLDDAEPVGQLHDDRRQEAKPQRDRLLTGALLGAVIVLLLSGAAFVYSLTGGKAAGGTATGLNGTPAGSLPPRQLTAGEERSLSIRLMTDGDPLSDGLWMSRGIQGGAQPFDPRGLQGGAAANQGTNSPTPTPQPTPGTPEAADDFTAEPSPTATPQPPAPASDDLAAEPDPTATPVSPSASDELAAEPEPTATATPPAAGDELAAEPEPTPSPTPAAPSDELSAEPTAAPAPAETDSLTLATAAPADDASDTTLVAPSGP